MYENRLVQFGAGGLLGFIMIRQVLAERYHVKKKLGSGAFADVYLAHDSVMERSVALKVFKAELIGDITSAQSRWRSEVKIIQSLRHDNIVAVYDLQHDKDEGIWFLVMEFCGGGSLRECIRGRRLDTAEVAYLLKTLSSAVDYAHAKGVIHRDIKPQNVLLSEDGAAKLADFGVAKLVAGTTMTFTGARGTPCYMPPESIEGRIDHRFDVYSFGIMALEMLLGHHPVRGSDFCRKVRESAGDFCVVSCVKRRRDFLQGVRAREVFERVLAEVPENRHQTAGEFVDDLIRALPELAMAAPRTLFVPQIPTPKADATKRATPVSPGVVLEKRARRDELVSAAAEAEKQGDLPEALALLEEALRVLPSEALEDNLKNLRRRYENYKKCKETGEQAEQKGDLKEALKQYRAALEANPGSSILRERIQRITVKIDETKATEARRAQAAAEKGERFVTTISEDRGKKFAKWAGVVSSVGSGLVTFPLLSFERGLAMLFLTLPGLALSLLVLLSSFRWGKRRGILMMASGLVLLVLSPLTYMLRVFFIKPSLSVWSAVVLAWCIGIVLMFGGLHASLQRKVKTSKVLTAGVVVFAVLGLQVVLLARLLVNFYFNLCNLIVLAAYILLYGYVFWEGVSALKMIFGLGRRFRQEKAARNLAVSAAVVSGLFVVLQVCSHLIMLAYFDNLMLEKLEKLLLFIINTGFTVQWIAAVWIAAAGLSLILLKRTANKALSAS